MAKRILVVDDQLAIRNMFKAIFASTSHAIDLAVDGADGYNKAMGTQYDLIITDYHMPNMNGIELIKKLRAGSRYTGFPILMVTTEGSKNKKEEGKLAGATGWMTKPISAEVLLPVIDRLVK